MESEMLPVYVAAAMVTAHGRAAVSVAEDEARSSLHRGDVQIMRVWRTVAGVAGLALSCDPHGAMSMGSPPLRFRLV